MESIKTPIEGLLILQPRIFYDERGYFFESYNIETLRQLGIHEVFVQDNQSYSAKGVLRGLHFQKPPFAQAKLVRVIKGMVLDVAVDLRKDSPTYGEHFSIILSEENQLQFFIPSGFAHGFVSMEDHTIFTYKCSAFYHKASEGTIRYDDPDLNIDWQTEHPIVNTKDIQGDFFKDFSSMF